MAFPVKFIKLNNVRIPKNKNQPKKKPRHFSDLSMIVWTFFLSTIHLFVVFICPCLIVLWQRRSVGEWVTTPPSSSLPWSPPWSWFSSSSPCIYPTGNHRNKTYGTYSQKSPNRKCLSWPWRKLDRRPLKFMFYRTLCVWIWKVIHNLCVKFHAIASLVLDLP